MGEFVSSPSQVPVRSVFTTPADRHPDLRHLHLRRWISSQRRALGMPRCWCPGKGVVIVSQAPGNNSQTRRAAEDAIALFFRVLHGTIYE